MINLSKAFAKYDLKNLNIGVLGSHSALDICRGAKDEGFQTLVVCQAGREKTYHDYYRTDGELGCVDTCITLPKFSDILETEIQQELISRNVIFVPHRSFEVYLNSDYKAIENDFIVPMFGNRYLLKIEERGVRPNQYDILDEAHIRHPRLFTDPKDIDRLCLVKVLEKERVFERAFFLVKDFTDYQKKATQKIKAGIITREQLKKAVIEEFIVGVQVNFNFFYSAHSERLELMGTDTRRQTNLDGVLRLPSWYQEEAFQYRHSGKPEGRIQNQISDSGQARMTDISYEEAGHMAVTVLESMLEDAFAMGERFVKAAQKMYAPGVIGPFALQSIITPGPPKKDIVVIDVSPRVPGSPGISATPYGSYLYGKPVGVGRRIAMEIKEAVKLNKLSKLIS